MNRKRIIAKEFREKAREIFKYIDNDSHQNADKFIVELLKQIDIIESNPEAYPPVANFPNKTHRYRYKIFMKSFKIVYKCLKKSLIFVGLLHTHQGSEAYKKLRKNKYE
jgi:plasmid stabilization system protein ParE